MSKTAKATATSKKPDGVPITHFRDHMREYLSEAEKAGSLKLTQGKYLPYQTFYLIPTRLGVKRPPSIIYY